MKFKVSVIGFGHTAQIFTQGFIKMGYQVTNTLDESKYIFVTEDLTIDDNNKIKYKRFNQVIKLLSESLTTQAMVVISSQVPVGQSRKITQVLKVKNPKIEVIYFQENLRVGEGLKHFLQPDRVVLGGERWVLEKFKKDFSFFKCPVLMMSLESAEMSKHALNAYLAMNISFSSEIGDICELVGADLTEVVKALLSDSRVSNLAPIKPGVGFAGGSLKRDIKHLNIIAKKYKLKTHLLNAALKVNETRIDYLMSRIQKILGSIKGKNIGLLGLTYKPNSSVLNQSFSIKLAQNLTQAHVKGFDPGIKEKIKNIDVCLDTTSFFKDLDLAILLSEWPDFKLLDFKKVKKLMRQPNILDTKSYLDGQKFRNSGFDYFKVGKI